MYRLGWHSTFVRMRALLPALAAVVLGAHAAEAQAERARRAFEPSVSLTFSPKLFGTRLEGPGGDEFSYKSSVGLSLWGELPVTRRTGLLAAVTASPFSKQRVDGGAGNVVVDQTVVLVSADVGVGARFKPAAPVFFFLGGGVVSASRYAAPQADGGSVEPQGTVAVGYDARRRGPWNFRALYTGHVVKPADPEAPDISPSSTAFDWTIQLGGRYTFGLAESAR